MTLNIAKEVAALERMTVSELRERYAEVFGEPTRAPTKAWLVQRIAWRHAGRWPKATCRSGPAAGRGIGQRRRPAAHAAQERDNDAIATEATRRTVTIRDRRRPPADARHGHSRAQYKGRTLQVKVLADGFEFEGEVTSRCPPWPRPSPARTGTAFISFGLDQKGGQR